MQLLFWVIYIGNKTCLVKKTASLIEMTSMTNKFLDRVFAALARGGRSFAYEGIVPNEKCGELKRIELCDQKK